MGLACVVSLGGYRGAIFNVISTVIMVGIWIVPVLVAVLAIVPVIWQIRKASGAKKRRSKRTKTATSGTFLATANTVSRAWGTAGLLSFAN
jgi:hypothetical protein